MARGPETHSHANKERAGTQLPEKSTVISDRRPTGLGNLLETQDQSYRIQSLKRGRKPRRGNRNEDEKRRMDK